MIGMKHEVRNNNLNIAQARFWNNKLLSALCMGKAAKGTELAKHPALVQAGRVKAARSGSSWPG